MILKKWSLFATLILALCLALAACSGDDDNAPNQDDMAADNHETDDDTGDNGNNKDNAGDGELADDQVLNVNIKEEPPSLHPGKASDATSSAVIDQIFEGLTRLNQEGETEEAMAESIDISDDQKTYTFHLRDDVNWTNGDPVTAGDFEFAWKWVLDPDSPDTDYAYQLYSIKNAQAAKEEDGDLDDVGVTAVDDKTLVVELKEPTPYFLELTAMLTYYPVNEDVVKGEDDWAIDVSDKYVTNGPFTLESWSHKDQIVLKKNEDYWDSDAVHLKTINMFMVVDESTELKMFKQGDLDWAGDPTGSIPLAAKKSLEEEEELNISPRSGIYYYSFNNEEEPFNNVNIRKAFAFAINREGIVEKITQSQEQPAMGLVPPSIFEENKEGYFEDNDPEQAKEYLEKGLDELGMDELPPVTISYNTDEGHEKIAQAVQDMWKENLGVDVDLENLEWKVYLNAMEQGDYQIGRMGFIADFNDAINFLEIFQENRSNNYPNWENDEYYDLLEQSRTETDSDERYQILRDAEALFMDEMPLAPVYYYTNVWTQKDYVKDIEVSPLGSIQYKWGWIAEE